MYEEKINLLVSINEIFASVRNPEEIVTSLLSRLHAIENTQVGGMCLFVKDKDYSIVIFSEISALEARNAALNDSNTWVSTVETSQVLLGSSLSAGSMVVHETPELLQRTHGNGIYDQLRKMLKKHRIDGVCQIPMRCAGEIIGYLLLGYSGENPFARKDRLKLIMRVADVVGVGTKNFVSFEEIKKRELFQSTLLRITNNLVTIKNRDNLFERLFREFNSPLVGERFYSFAECRLSGFFPGDPVIVRFLLNDRFEYIPYGSNSDTFSVIESVGFHPASADIPLIIAQKELKECCNKNERLSAICNAHNVDRMYWKTYTTNDGARIEALIGMQETIVPPVLELSFASHMLPQIAVLLKNLAAYEEIDSLKKQLEQEKVSLLGEISERSGFQEIIGESPVMQNVLYKVQQVASIDATVLILGETGTGKELIARAIHNISDRKDNPMIKINCATLPAQLIESELFGHERGSFTGAVEKRLGKFELANGGSIFLDEIGEMPLELQAKLLRVLQEKEFERIGGKQTIRTNVRVIAATNRDLEEEVKAGRFRSDLFFRLNVFPITVPPLRERLGDIPLFVRYFAGKFARAMGRNVKEINRQELDAFAKYDWPGNIRELEHVIERATIISQGPTLDFSDVKFLKSVRKQEEAASFKPLRDMEKDYIIAALRAANGKVMGENSASSLLGINGKTLGSKMRKFGIKREITINY